MLFLELILPHPRLMKRLEISNWLSKVGSMVLSGPILLFFLISNHVLFNLSVIRSGKGGIRRLISGELRSAIRALLEEAEAVVFLDIVTNGGEGLECNEWNPYNTRDDHINTHGQGKRTCRHREIK